MRRRLSVAVGMSGGVDSAVAAWILKQRRYDVLGLFMKNWDEDDSNSCSAAEDLRYVRAVCDQLSMPLHTVNFATEYWNNVFQVALAEYRRGRTPNPDVLCNREIKFNVFAHHAHMLGVDKIATGHYAGIERHKRGRRLTKSLDPDKDQTYFLYMLNQQALQDSLFPLHGIVKNQVRQIAREQQLKPADRKDSSGVCFIGERPFRRFLARYLPTRKGAIVDTNGCVVGEHEGLWFYTIGQRRGLGIGGLDGAAEMPWYVIDKDMTRNQLQVAQGHDHAALFKRRIIVEQVHWIHDSPHDHAMLHAKIRHRQTGQVCRIEHRNDRLHALFDLPQWGVAPGQSLVLYTGNTCLGGGIIVQALSE